MDCHESFLDWGMGIDCMVQGDVLVRQVRKVNARDQEF